MNFSTTADFPVKTVSFVSWEEVSSKIPELVKRAIREERTEELQEKLLSPEATSELFSPRISVATLNNYAKSGLLKKYYLGRLTFFKYSEVIEALKTIKKYSRSHS